MAAPASAASATASKGGGKSGRRPRRRGRNKQPQRGGASKGASTPGGSAAATAASGTGAPSAKTPATPAGEDSGSPAPHYRPHKVPLIHLTDDTPSWYECGRNSSGRDDTLGSVAASASNNSSSNKYAGNKHVRRNDPAVVRKYRALAEKMYQHELALSRQSNSSHNSSSSDRDGAWVESTMRRGTLKDRVAAMSVVVSDDPVHKLYALDMLLGMVGVTIAGSNSHSAGPNGSSSMGAGAGGAGAGINVGRPNDRVAHMASEALVDLFVNTLLPPGRKLISLDQRPLYLYEQHHSDESGKTDEGGGKKKRGNTKGSKNWDDGKNDAEGKQTTKRTLSPRILLLWRYEELLQIRYRAFLQYLNRTLSTPTALPLTKTNSLRTAASLLKEVPEGEAELLNMVVNKLGDPARKVASCAGHELRGVLEVHPRMVGVVAREVQQLAHRPNLSSRALYNCIIFLNQLKLTREEEEEVGKSANDIDSDDDDAGGDKEHNNKAPPPQPSLAASLINTYFRLFEVAIKKSEAARDRNHKKGKGGGDTTTHDDGTMKGRLLSALLTGVNRAHPYLPRRDADMDRHVDALYRIAHTSPPAACTQALMLLFNLAVGTSSDRAGRGGGGAGDAAAKGSAAGARKDATARGDRFYRALYSKLSDPAMLTGRQLTMFFNLLYKAMKHDADSDARVVAFAKRLLHTAFHSPASSVIAASLFLVSEVVKFRPALRSSLEEARGEVFFDPTKREPRAAFVRQGGGGGGTEGAAGSNAGSLWEASLASQHYHPTVRRFASTLGEVEYDGDPLRDFALAPFLDRLAYRNPKSREHILRHLKRGESVAERRSGVERGIGTLSSLPVNDPAFLERAAASKSSKGVGRESEEFFYRFFVERAKRDKVKGIVRGTGDRSTQHRREEEGNGSDAEFDAIDAEEMKGAVDDRFEEGWDTDPEEEEFANQLAEKLMESAGNGKANLDNEDPDMEGWDDLDSSGDEGKDGSSAGEEEDIDYSAMDGIGMDGADSSEDEDVAGNAGGLVDADAFMDADTSDSDDEEASGNNVGPRDGDDSSDESDAEDGFEASLLADSDDESGDDGDENRREKEKKAGNEKNKQKLSESFVDASEYEEMIAKGWKDRKRPVVSDFDVADDADGDKHTAVLSSGGKKKRKRRIRAKH